MLSVEEALQLVLSHPLTLPKEEVELLSSVGRVLAQEVRADRDFPPFHRVTMDGIAIQEEAFATGTRMFAVQEIQAAGTPQATLQNQNGCIEVMTGAILPAHCDTVIPYEQCEIVDGYATVQAEQVKAGQNIHRQGVDGKADQILLTSNQKITPAMIGTMASVGLARVQVWQNPRIAICSTGDELVEIEEQPLPHQIRRSNAYMLAAALQIEGLSADLFHIPDEPSVMRVELANILAQHDVLLLSGAVSKGKFDFVPDVLEELGLQLIFHKIAQRPGKPLLFGTLPENKVVFGLPGNPVSSFVCYHLYLRPWLYQTLQLTPDTSSAQLAQDITFTPAIAYHVPVTIQHVNGTLHATPVETSGSGDLTSLLKADALLSLPADKENFTVGEAFPLTLL